jgi:hypothetical protein
VAGMVVVAPTPVGVTVMAAAGDRRE